MTLLLYKNLFELSRSVPEAKSNYLQKKIDVKFNFYVLKGSIKYV